MDSSEFTQQDGKTLGVSVTNMTGLLLACFVGKSLNIDVFCSSKKICLKECEVWRKVFSNIIVTLVTQVLRPLSFPVLLRA